MTHAARLRELVALLEPYKAAARAIEHYIEETMPTLMFPRSGVKVRFGEEPQRAALSLSDIAAVANALPLLAEAAEEMERMQIERDELEMCLSNIANEDDEDSEWDAVAKFHDVRDQARGLINRPKALSPPEGDEKL